MALEELVRTYGYLAVLVGTLVEGETIAAIAGFLAHRGYLDFPWVVIMAFVGTFISDQGLFYIGRVKGTAQLEKRPEWKAKADRVLALLNRYQNWLILGFRFLYGLRTVTPLMIGLSRVGRLRYLVLNGIGALVWAISIVSLGYFMGHAAELVLGRMEKYEGWIIAFLALIGAFLWLASWLNGRKRRTRGGGINSAP
jgi:membrane protein DedA with SNARE-associated domain